MLHLDYKEPPVSEAGRLYGSMVKRQGMSRAVLCGEEEPPGIERSFPAALTREMMAGAVQRGDVAANGLAIERAYSAAVYARHGLNPTKEQIGRGYEVAMQTVHGYVPSLEDIVGLAIEEATAWDGQKRRVTQHLLDRFMCRNLGPIQRTGVGSSGPTYGFTLPIAMAADVFDRARQTDGPWSRANWWPVGDRQFVLPTVAETSRARGSRFGGITSQWGTSEIVLAPAADGALGGVNLIQERLTVFTAISNDLYRDAAMVTRWLDYAAIAEFRAAIEACMILGVDSAAVSGGPLASPQGVIGAPSTVVVAKDSMQSSGTISASNIDNMWAAIAPANAENAVWHANKSTIGSIDKLAVSGQFPEGLYLPQGVGGNKHALIKGRPLIPTEFAPNIGTQGDLICVDWSDYVLTYMQKKPLQSPLSFYVVHPQDLGHKGIIGMPDGSVEARMSDQFYFSTDLMAFAFKYRGTGHFVWQGTSKDAAGNVIGPAAVIAAR